MNIFQQVYHLSMMYSVENAKKVKNWLTLFCNMFETSQTGHRLKEIDNSTAKCPRVSIRKLHG
jgi:hypothetical protein